MPNDPTSLERLHDIVAPPPVSWWPVAPGWWALLAVAACLFLALLYRAWKRWRTNAYRRAALRELEAADSAAIVSEVLKRAALAVAPRENVAALAGAAWPAWLTAQSPDGMSDSVREQLASGVYRERSDAENIKEMQTYAIDWIRHHRAAN